MIAIKKEHLVRQADIIPLSALNTRVTIIGAGAVGSFTAFALAKMGYNDINIYDFDTVSIENMNSQMYRFSDINRPKVDCLKEIIKDFADVNINAHNTKYQGDVFQDIVIAAVDNMETRKAIYNAHKDMPYITSLYIDPRMAIEYAYIQAFNPNDAEQCALYEKTLFTDENAVQDRCTNKSTIYTSQLIGATIAKIVKDITTNKKHINRIMWDIAGNDVMDVTQIG